MEINLNRGTSVKDCHMTFYRFTNGSFLLADSTSCYQKIEIELPDYLCKGNGRA